MKIPGFAWLVGTVSCLLCCVNIPSLQAQRLAERFVIFNSLSTPFSALSLPNERVNTPPRSSSPSSSATADSALWLGNYGFYAGFSRYLVADNAHGWYSPLGAFVEIFRFGNAWNLYAIGTFDHVADLNNDISFNPRAVWWEEGIMFSTRLDSVRLAGRALPSYLHVGYFHRCKHDVDNLDNQEGRVMIYGSITGKYILEIPSLTPHEHLTFAVRTDIYTVRTDYRFPRDFERVGRSYFDLVASVGANLHYRAALPVKQLGWYANARFLTTAFGTNRDFFGRFATINELRTDYSLSLGLAVEGASRVQIGLTYEYLTDPETKPFPSPQHSLTLGFTFSSVQGLW
jgi:hypothetical protein